MISEERKKVIEEYGKKLLAERKNRLLITEEDIKEVPLSSQERKYKTEAIYIGDKTAYPISKYEYEFENIKLEVESTANDSLVVKQELITSDDLPMSETTRNESVVERVQDATNEITIKYDPLVDDNNESGQEICVDKEGEKIKILGKALTTIYLELNIEIPCDLKKLLDRF